MGVERENDTECETKVTEVRVELSVFVSEDEEEWRTGDKGRTFFSL